MNLDVLLVKAINASVKGGISVMDIYGSDFKVESKKDDSPLTLADKNCNDVICSYLKNTGIPILSEEGIDIAFKDRQKWEYYWLVDPLDGTKEFVNRNGEFTVNIALIHFDKPVMGVVYVPVKEVMYFALEGLGSYMVRIKSIINDLEYLILNSTKLPINYNRKNYVVVGSRSHMSIETNQFIDEKIIENSNLEIISVGSSLKICMVAEGKADCYPRYAPTMEWDIAAGHAIAKMAGFSVQKYGTKKELVYNKKTLLNPWFLVH